MVAQLVGSLVIFEKFIEGEGWAKMPVMMGSLLLLAGAVSILADAMNKMAGLSWNDLSKGLTGISVGITDLILAVRLMGSPENMISIGLGMMALAKAVERLTTAVKALAVLSWDELGKGLAGVGAILLSLTLFSKFAEADKAGAVQGLGILLLAQGIKILAAGIKEFSAFSWDEIGKGLATLAGSLLALGATLKLIPPESVFSAAAVLIVATSLGMIGDAVKNMGKMSWSEIGKGLTELAGAMVLIAAALILIPPTSILSAAAILVVAESLGMITKALGQMGSMSWTEIAKSLIELAGSLAIIAGAMYLMIEALPGAAALLVVAASLAILEPVLKAFGDMSWGEIGKSLLVLAGVFVIFGAAGYLLTPVVPVLIGLGIAIALMGVGALAAGVGVLAFSAALTALAGVGAAGAAAITFIVKNLIGLIPLVMEEIGKGVIAFAKVIATAGPAITDAITTVILALISAIDKMAPQVIETLGKLLGLMLDFLVKYVPKLVDAGLKILIGFLTGIKNNIGEIVTVASDLIVNFINGISANLPKLAQAGANLIINFINTLANTIRSNSAALGAAGSNLATSIIEGMVSGLAGGVGKVVSEAKNVAESAFNAAKKALDVNSPSKKFITLGESGGEGLVVGFENSHDMVGDAAVGMGQHAMDSLKGALAGISSALTKDIDARPTITPVLDLSEVKKSAGQIGGYLSTAPLTVDTSYSSANNASLGYLSNLLAAAQSAIQPSTNPVTFNQYNNSPVALSNAEIYRQTRNQLSIAKGALPA
jgi:hypothetical protein